jgi:hypothetical protein
MVAPSLKDLCVWEPVVGGQVSPETLSRMVDLLRRRVCLPNLHSLNTTSPELLNALLGPSLEHVYLRFWFNPQEGIEALLALLQRSNSIILQRLGLGLIRHPLTSPPIGLASVARIFTMQQNLSQLTLKLPPASLPSYLNIGSYASGRGIHCDHAPSES